MLTGYGRVSTEDQGTAAQVAALTFGGVRGSRGVLREPGNGRRWESILRGNLELQSLVVLRYPEELFVMA